VSARSHNLSPEMVDGFCPKLLFIFTQIMRSIRNEAKTFFFIEYVLYSFMFYYSGEPLKDNLKKKYTKFATVLLLQNI
jgi:hypothetical protein